MKRIKCFLFLILCLSVFFIACDKDNSGFAHIGKSICANDLKINIEQEGYVGGNITKSMLNESIKYYSETIDCGDGLSADITFSEDPEILYNEPNTRVLGDDTKNISDGNYVIFAYDQAGDCVDYLKFSINAGTVTYTADSQLITGKPNGYGNNTELVADGTQKYVCVRLVSGVTPNYADGTVIFSQTTSNDMEKYFISDVFYDSNFPTNKTLRFLMRRQSTCIRVKINAIDAVIGGKISLTMANGAKIAKELVYDRKSAGLNEIYPENIVKAETTPSYSYELKDQEPVEIEATALSEMLPYHSVVDFYILGDPNIDPKKFKATLADIKDGDIEIYGAVTWITSKEVDFSTLGNALSVNKLEANHRYAFNVDLKLIKTYNVGQTLPLGYPELNKYYTWGAFADVVNGNDNPWGPGSRKINEEVQWFITNSGKDLADYEKEKLGAVTTTTAKSPESGDLLKYISNDSKVYWDPGFVFAINGTNPSTNYWTRNADGKALRASSKGIWLEKWENVKNNTPLPMSGTSTGSYWRDYDTFDPNVRTNTNFFFLSAAGYYWVESQSYYSVGTYTFRVLREVEPNFVYPCRPYLRFGGSESNVFVDSSDRDPNPNMFTGLTMTFAYPADWSDDETFVAPL